MVDPSQNLDDRADILVEGGEVRAVARPGGLNSLAEEAGAQIVDASGMHVLPGCVDLNVEITDSNINPFETFATASDAAAAGGVTSVLAMPGTEPVCDNAYTADLLHRKARDAARVRTFFAGSVSKNREGESLAEIGLMKEAGIVAVAEYGQPVADTYLMKKAIEYVQGFHLPLFSFPQDRALVGKGVMQEGINSTRLGLRGIPSAAEEIMVHRDLVLQKFCGGRLHFNSVTTKGSLDAIRQAKRNGQKVTVDTNPHYFSLNSDRIASYDANYKVSPPLRSENEQNAVIDALADGTIDAIASNHIALPFSAKDSVFEFAASGIIGLETLLPLTLDLVHKKAIKLPRLVELLAANPAKILGKSKLGNLRAGSCADFVLVDLKKKYNYRKSDIKSVARNTPFIDREFTGQVQMTFVNGTRVYEVNHE